MNIFIILAAILITLALVFVLPLLLHDHSKSGQWLIPVLIITVPLLSVSIYLSVGNYEAINLSNNQTQVNSSTSHPSMNELVERLAERMRNNPNDVEGWLMLGRSALVLGQQQRAMEAYAQALNLEPKNPDVLLDYANAIFEMTQQLKGKPYELVATALTLAPNHPRALWLMGLAEFEATAYPQALKHWSQLINYLPSQGKEATALEKLINEAKQRMNEVKQKTQ
jgi:cytochrome c-type biogenesis protein CcmH